MELTLKRIAKKPMYTVGRMYVNGVYFCDTLEDTDRGLRIDMPLEELRRLKHSGVTAIPTGCYYVTLHIASPKFKGRPAYVDIGGRLPRLAGVPGFDGVLIHIGNRPEDTEGCILVGKNKSVGAVLDSSATFFSLYDKLTLADKRGEIIRITVC
jgi:hypothetical protein